MSRCKIWECIHTTMDERLDQKMVGGGGKGKVCSADSAGSAEESDGMRW